MLHTTEFNIIFDEGEEVVDLCRGYENIMFENIEEYFQNMIFYSNVFILKNENLFSIKDRAIYSSFPLINKVVIKKTANFLKYYEPTTDKLYNVRFV